MRLSDLLSQLHSDSEANQQRLEEYKFLRFELEAIWGQTYSTLNFMLAVIGLIVTAAYSQWGDPVILLPMASIVTLGAYELIVIHTKRVWRIVGYMRCALETNLKGIRWETRLAARHRALKGMGHTHFDSDIFDGHILILDTVNFALLLGICLSGFFGHSALVTFAVSKGGKFGWLVIAAGSFFPALALSRSISRKKGLKRGEDLEKKHLRSWNYDEHGTKVSAAEPPLDWTDYFEH